MWFLPVEKHETHVKKLYFRWVLHAKSMTGFGRALIENDQWSITCEIKALNGRYFEADIRLPKFLNELDSKIRRELSEFLERGTISVNYSVRFSKSPSQIQVNTDLALSYLQAIRNLEETTGHTLEDPIREILRNPEVLSAGEKELSEELKQAVIQVTLNAAEVLDAFRKEEGKATSDTLKMLIHSISDDVLVIENEEQNRREAIRERVYGNVLEHVKEHLVDENRLEQEVLLYLDKWDISEEKQRLSQHLDFFMRTLKEEPKGRKLNFIAQEMGREMNTLGVKSNYFPMQECVVAMKEKLEQIKEQVLNIV
jgi:uncharacterized protein (TIGR00255 family)